MYGRAACSATGYLALFEGSEVRSFARAAASSSGVGSVVDMMGSMRMSVVNQLRFKFPLRKGWKSKTRGTLKLDRIFKNHGLSSTAATKQ